MKWIALASLLLGGCAPAEAQPRTPSKAHIAAPAEGRSSENDPDAKLPPRTDQARPNSERSATEAPPTHLDESGCRVPWDFDLDALLATVESDPASRKSATLRILTWQVEVDDRPLLIDSVIVWIHRDPPRGTDSWQLAHLFRHPLDARKDWEVSTVFDVPYVGEQAYSAPPTAREFEGFLRDTWWTFRATDGFRLLDADVCEKAWTLSIGSAANHHYP